jgi:hypothetical protein
MDKLSDDMDGTATRLDLVQVQHCTCILLGWYFYQFGHTLPRPVAKLLPREQIMKY